MSSIRAKIHRLNDEDRAIRDAKIVRMVSLGCAYEDIAKRYGISKTQVGKVAKDNGKKNYLKNYFGGDNRLCRAMFLDGLD